MNEGVTNLLKNIDYLLATRGPFDKPGDVVGLHLRTSDWQEVAAALRQTPSSEDSL